MAAALTPLQYAEKYWNLPVPIVEDSTETVKEWITVRVASYRLGLHTAAKEEFMSKLRPRLDQKDGKKKVSESVTVFVKTVGGLQQQRTYQSKNALGAIAVDPYYGKGSPEECQVTLQLAIRFGVIKPKPGQTIQSATQDYCNTDKLGLDCNGFVGNYIRHVVNGVDWASDPPKGSQDLFASSTINSLIDRGERIASIEQIVQGPVRSYLFAEVDRQTGRILDRADPGHVMITQPSPIVYKPWKVWAGGFGGVNYNNVPSFDVVESTGKDGMIASLTQSGNEGLVRSTYLLLEEDRRKRFTVFKIHRGSKAGSRHETMYVVISTVKGA